MEKTEKEAEKSPLLGLISGEIGPEILVLFGEDPGVVRRCLDELGFELIKIGRRRESVSWRVEREGLSIPVVLAGCGSASAVATVQELVNLGGRRLVMAGSCGGSADFPCGSAYLISRARLHPLGGGGGLAYYFRTEPGEVFTPSPKLLDRGRSLHIPEAPVTLISVDAFQGFGGELGRGGKLSPGGAFPKKDRDLPGFAAFRKLYQSKKPFLIDMETAFFYGLLRVWPDLEGIAVRAVSNHLPFDPEDPVPAEEPALLESLKKAVDLLAAAAG